MTDKNTRLEWCCTCRFWQPDKDDSERGECRCMRSPMVMNVTFHADSCVAWDTNNAE